MVVICSICQGSLACPPKTLISAAGIEYDNNNCMDISTAQTDPKTNQGENKYEPHAIAPMCGHLFHSACLAQWFANNGEHKCPVCSCSIPTDQMTKIYLSTGPEAGKSDSNLISGSGSNAKSTDSDSTSAQEPSSVSAADADSALSNPSNPAAVEMEANAIPEEPMPLQMTETTENGVRTVVYRFSLKSDNKGNDGAQAQSSQRERRRESRGRSRNRHHVGRQENSDRSRSPHRCLNCSTLEQIQSLMMKEMADLKRVVAEQKAMISSLEQTLKLSSSGASNSLGHALAQDVNANLV